MTRIVPCQYCKKRRRKCEKISECEPCRLCHRLKKTCVPSIYYHSEWSECEEDTIAYDQFEVIYFQMRDLQRQVQQLETELAQEPQKTGWMLEKRANKLYLLSTIADLEELLQYAHYAIRYLSPFGHLFFKNPLIFQANTTGAIPILLDMVAQHVQTPTLPAASTPEIIKYRFMDGLAQYLQPERCVRSLIDSYFACHQGHLPLLHEPSFRAYYERLSHPLEDPITMGICTYTTMLECRRHQVFLNQPRSMAEVYYALCMRQLIDIFDDPERALDALITIELVRDFMMLTMRFSENYRWSGVASVLVANLKTAYPDYAQAQVDPAKRIRYALIHRAICRHQGSIGTEQIVGFAEKKGRQASVYEPLDSLPGESDPICRLVEMANHWRYLSALPQFGLLSRFTSRQPTQLEDLVRFEQMVTAWWHQVPNHLKLHADLLHVTEDHVKACDDWAKLAMMMQVHLLKVVMQAQLVLPGLDLGLPIMMRDRALYLLKQSFLISLVLIQRAKQHCIDTSVFLMRSLDILIMLLKVDDREISYLLQTVAEAYLKELECWNVPESLRSDQSPFSILSVVPSTETGMMIPLTELYKEYPAPGPAMMFDVLYTSLTKLIKKEAL
ncbi:hypothetical protein EDC96DRAFT_523238 [Choanephora cucurbitarum]|nr:hypothetical protein EDC96DRAFT_523238 [Choanephora cucurbitarum]